MPGVKGEVTVKEPTRAEATLIRRNAEARATVPDLELAAEVELTAARELGFGATTLLVRACALALRALPRANGSYRDGRYELYSRVNVGVAFGESEAPMIPTVFDADRKPLEQLEQELHALLDRARGGELTPPELAGATFTLHDMSSHAIGAVTPLLIPPQAAALAAGEVRELPRIRDGAIVPTATMTLTLAADSRILNGAHAARLLVSVREHLEQARL